LGQVTLIRGNFTNARRRFDSVIASNNKSVGVPFLNGYISWKQKNPKSAMALFEKP